MVDFAKMLAATTGKPVPKKYQITTVEDILQIVVNAYEDGEPAITKFINGNAWMKKFTADVYKWTVSRDKPLTTDQAAVIMRLFRQLKPILISIGHTSEELADHFVQNPRYNHPLRPSLKIEREIRYVGGNRFAARFKQNDGIKTFLETRISGSRLFETDVATEDKINRIWIIEVNRETLEPIMEMISIFKFGFDAAVEQYLVEAYNAMNEPCSFHLRDGKIVAEVNDNELVSQWVRGPLQGRET